MSPTTFAHYARVVLITAILWPLCSLGQVLNIPDFPLFLSSTGVTPNIILTLDDSGSMRRAYVPEICGDDSNCVAMINRYYKSAHYNALYYNPNIIYTAPKNAAGASLPSSSNMSSTTNMFSTVYKNGFVPNFGTPSTTSDDTLNLSTNYRPTANLDLDGSATLTLTEHYRGQRGVTGVMMGTDSGTNAPYFDIPNFWNKDGSATTHDPVTNLVSVTVEGSPFLDAGILSADSCNTSNDPSTGQYRTRRIGTTLRLCFNDTSSYYDTQVEVRLKDVDPTAAEPSTATSGATAYYYLYDPDNGGNCTGTDAEKKVNNSCYDFVQVSSTSGPATKDLNGDGDINADDSDERQNFANWYSFYRTRNLATVSGASLAFSSLEDEPTCLVNEEVFPDCDSGFDYSRVARVAWQGLLTCRGSDSSLLDTSCEGWTGTYGSNAIGNFTGTKKTNFYNWLAHVPTYQGTPLRLAMTRVGEYIRTTGENSPWDNDFTTSASGQHSCRRNFHILMTDGIWNDSDSAISVSNVDNTAISTLPDGTGSYNPSMPPYRDTSSKTIADIAFKYWSTDLRNGASDNSPNCIDSASSSTCNTLPVVYIDRSGNDNEKYWNAKNNPATWQHLVNFTVGLGLTDFLAAAGLTWDGDTYSGSYTALVAGPPSGISWPAATAAMGLAGTDYGKSAHDLWHAAINSRGKFYSAESPQQIVDAFADIMNTISAQPAAGGGAGLGSNTTQTTQEGATAFEARFLADWSGLLIARPIMPDGSFGAYNYWEAGERIPPASLRKIFTRNGNTVQEFTSCEGVLADTLNQDANGTPDNLCEQRLAWLRGYNATITSASWAGDSDPEPPSAPDIVTFNTEQAHGLVAGDTVLVTGVVPTAYNGNYTVETAAANSFTAVLNTNPDIYNSEDSVGKVWKRYPNVFRDRVSALGDIMNSDPIYAYNEDFGYNNATAVTGNDSYESYVNTTKANRTPVIYVGANDGMLHAFKGGTTGDDAGVELFAYVPTGVYHNLSALTATDYTGTHKYFVDGPPTVGDAYIGGWKTYLVGGLGAGGKSIYALDVSDPDNFEAADIKWEFTDTDDLGLTFSQPQIAPVGATQWAAIFGNGYNSSTNRAVLYIVNLATGSEIAKIYTPIDTTLPTDTPNGLSTPYLYDSDGNRIVDVIYAGDLQGNLWKFENNADGWVLGNDGVPLFTARNAAGDVQSITAQPKAVVDDNGRLMVFFGTGRYLETGDLTNDEVQTFYGIWDNPEIESDTPRTVPRNDTVLLRQELTTDVSTRTRTITAESFDPETHRGCYVDLPATSGQPSERIIVTTLIKQFVTIDDRVLVTTATPSSDPCGKGGTSWFMEMNLSCGQLSASPFDLDANGQPDATNVTGIQLDTTGGIFGEPLWLEKPSNEPPPPGGEPPTRLAYKIFTGTAGTTQRVANFIEPIEESGGLVPRRIYWEQIQ